MSSATNSYLALSAAASLGAGEPLPRTSADMPLVARTGRASAFEGFLEKAGRFAGVALTEIIKYVIPVASIAEIADPEIAPAVQAFAASVKTVQAAVINVQQKWSSFDSETNQQKLADVLAIVELPVTTMFAQAGVQVDAAYVTNLVNGVVAILNAQPGSLLQR